MLCFESGGVLLNSVDELLSFDEWNDSFVSTESSPFLLSGQSQLEHHGEAGSSAATSFGSSMTQADRGER